MSITVRFNFRDSPGSANDTVAAAAELIRHAKASPFGCRIEVVRNGNGDYFADRLAELFGHDAITPVYE